MTDTSNGDLQQTGDADATPASAGRVPHLIRFLHPTGRLIRGRPAAKEAPRRRRRVIVRFRAGATCDGSPLPVPAGSGPARSFVDQLVERGTIVMGGRSVITPGQCSFSKE